MAIDQATTSFLQLLSENAPEPSEKPAVADVRLMMASLSEMYGSGPEMHAVHDYEIGPDRAQFPVRVLVPTSEPRGVLVYYHGGGWVIGSIDEYDTLGRKLAAKANVTVVLVGYRLAPEHPFPAGINDAWSAANWAADKATALPGNDGPLIVAGDSAGGNLAIITALKAREQGPKIGAVLLAYPCTDADQNRSSYLEPENQLLLTAEDVRWFLENYIGDRDPFNPLVSPLREKDLSGFPPTALAIAEHDPLRDEGLAFGGRLRDAGVDVAERFFEGQMHGFFQLVNVLPASEEANDWFSQFLDNKLFSAEGVLS